jgi:hypothetical protein
MKKYCLLLLLLCVGQAQAAFTLTQAHCDAIGKAADRVIQLKNAGFSSADTTRLAAMSAVKGAPEQNINLDIYPYVISIIAFLYSDVTVADGGKKLVEFSVQVCPKSIGATWQ